MAAVNYNDQARIAYLKWVSSMDTEAANKVRLYRDYAEGDQPVYLTERQKEFIGLKTDSAYVHNICRLVIDIAIERLKVLGFSPVGNPRLDRGEKPQPPGGLPAGTLGVAAATRAGGAVPPATNDLASAAIPWWDGNRMDAQQDDLYKAACRDGSAYIILDWDFIEKRPRWTVNNADDGTNGIWAHIDGATGKPDFYCKRWQVIDPLDKEQNGRQRLVLYYSERIEKFISAKGNHEGLGGTQWIEWRDTEDEAWPLPWVDKMGNPLGIPVIEFSNPGGSEIADLIPPQDMLNKSDVDLIAAADVSGFRILWSKGLIPKIVDGVEQEMTLKQAQILNIKDPNGSLNALEPIDLSNLINTCRYWTVVGAGITRTPQYLFQAMGADQPSGESLRMQELGLIAKCGRKQKVFGNAWEDVLYLSRKLHNFYSIEGEIAEGRVQTDWDVIETKDMTALAAEIKAKSETGVPNEQLWHEWGYEQAQIDEWKAEAAAKPAQEGALGAKLLQEFMAGRGQRASGQMQPGQEKMIQGGEGEQASNL